MKGDSSLWIAAGAAVALYLYSRSQQAATTPTPYSIYPEFAYTARTSMASTPQQKAAAAVVPTGQFTAVQAQQQAAILAQCAGSWPGCTVVSGDTQLGF